MKEIARNTYTYQVMQWLQSGRSITSKQAIDEFGCTRLAAIISYLRNVHELRIGVQRVDVKNRNGRYVSIAKYFLEEDKSQGCDSGCVK